MIKLFLYITLICTIISISACGQDAKPPVSKYQHYFGHKTISKIQFAHSAEIGKYDGNVERIFTDITFDYDEGRFHLPSANGMGQFPLSGVKINFNSGFTAETKPYEMVGFACNPFDGKMFALDGKGKQIITDKPNSIKIPLPSEIRMPTGICHDGTNLWICDSRSRIFKLSIKKGKIKIEDTISSPLKSPTGITWDGYYLWICSKNQFARVSEDFEILIEKELSRDIDGICVVSGNLWAIAYKRPEIYRYAISE